MNEVVKSTPVVGCEECGQSVLIIHATGGPDGFVCHECRSGKQRALFGQQTAGISHGAITQGDWAALCRTLYDAHEAFGTLSRPGLAVEVGTLGGRTTHGICEVLKSLRWDVPDVLTIDTDKPCLGRAHDLCIGLPNTLRTFHGRSTDWKPLEPIWWAFIDGCHCHDCVLADIYHLTPHMPSGAVVCLHDAGMQRNRGMLVHERYHNRDGVKRLYGVTSAIDVWQATDVDQEKRKFPRGLWVRVENVPAMERPKGAPTPLFGGLQAFRRK